MFGFVSSLVSSRSFRAAASLRERTVGCCSIIESSSLAARRDRDGALNCRNRTQRNRFRQPPVPKFVLRARVDCRGEQTQGCVDAPCWLTARAASAIVVDAAIPISLEASGHVPVDPRTPLRAPRSRERRAHARGDRGLPRRSRGSATSTFRAPPAAAAAAAKSGAGSTGSSAVVPPTETKPATVLARSVTDIRTIPGRLEFSLALERESARAARYGRPASVAIVELVPERPNHAVDIW